jgi:hypothetical protein
MQFNYRLVGSDAVDKPTRIDTISHPEMIPYLKSPDERLFLVPKADIEAQATLLRTTGAIVNVGLSDEGLTQLPPLEQYETLLAQIAQ